MSLKKQAKNSCSDPNIGCFPWQASQLLEDTVDEYDWEVLSFCNLA